MASIALKLINSVLYGGTPTYRKIVRCGFRPEWLQDIELKRTWDMIVSHIMEYKITPSKSYVLERMPSFQYLDIFQIQQESPEALCQLLREFFVQSQLFGIFEKGFQLNNATPFEAAAFAAEALSKLSKNYAPVDTIDLTENIDGIMEDYDASSTMAAHGLLLPWQGLHNETLGMHLEEFILVFGRPKSMKTFVALYMAAYAYLFSHARILIISRELSKEMMLKRLVATLAEVAYGPWRKGRLTPDGRARVYGVLESLVQMESEQYSFKNKALPPAIRIASGHSRQYSGMDLVEALADEFEPDLVFDDGLYLAANNIKGADPTDWRIMTALTQGCKSFAGRNKIVYLATTQANRATTKKDKSEQLTDLDGFSYADSYAQDCSLALRVMKQKEDRVRKLPSYLLIGLPGYREGEMDAFAIHGQPCSNFTEFTPEDYERFGIDDGFIRHAVKEDTLLTDIPAGPTVSCDRYETEIPTSLRESFMPTQVPMARTPKEDSPATTRRVKPFQRKTSE